MLLLGPQPPDQRVELPGSLELENALLGRRIGGRAVGVERVRGALTLRVAHRVAGDLEHPAGEAPFAAKATDLLERGGEHAARHVPRRWLDPGSEAGRSRGPDR